MKPILFCAAIIALITTTGCLVPAGEGRGHYYHEHRGYYAPRREVIVAPAPVVVVRPPAVLVRPPELIVR